MPALVLTVVILTSCSSSRRSVTKDIPVHVTAQEVVQSVRAAVEHTYHTLQITGDLSIKSPVFSGNLGAKITHRRGDTLHAVLTASALRIEAGQLWSTPDSFYFYNRVEKQVVYGPAELLEQVLPGLFSGPAVFDLLLGLVAPGNADDWILTSRKSLHHLRSENAGLFYAIDPTDWRVMLRRRRAADGTPLEVLQYADFAPSGTLLVPGEVILQRPAEEVTVVARYRAVRLDPPSPDFTVRIPPDVPRIRAEDIMPVPAHR